MMTLFPKVGVFEEMVDVLEEDSSEAILSRFCWTRWNYAQPFEAARIAWFRRLVGMRFPCERARIRSNLSS